YNNEAQVSINTTVRPVVSYPAQSCDAGIPKPDNAPDPHIVAYFTESRPERVYYAPNWTHYSPFFRFELSDTGEPADLQGVNRILYLREFSPEGGKPREYQRDLGKNASVGRFQFNTPGDRGRG
ncbi:hypothetical protein AB9K17_24100, partial [Salmonella enterica subsp. enterica serovar Kentucky]|uniref:hypothetical protein n=1 Tax=Salmonella enterica TaxID=28901 RepID=UPI003F4C48B3